MEIAGKAGLGCVWEKAESGKSANTKTNAGNVKDMFSSGLPCQRTLSRRDVNQRQLIPSSHRGAWSWRTASNVLSQSHASLQIMESRVGAERIELWLDVQVPQP